ncbi:MULTISPECIES: HalOD1 output domain-containing protein [Haloarcula]|uniref:HalOD1 output domain-containing protein n=1 Tax=Haloarcula TaxID=2237 RepID=UPI0023EDB59E|nr:HalOD1 output domain-containing protein [Halomicroarcula sp. XH51]
MNSPSDEIAHRQLEVNQHKPSVQIAKIVADLEGKQPEELTPTYEHLGNTIDEIFSNPPVRGAQVGITFSYEGYRIIIEQNGSAQFVKTA